MFRVYSVGPHPDSALVDVVPTSLGALLCPMDDSLSFVGLGPLQQQQETRDFTSQAYGTVEELRKYIETTREKLVNDPRTKQMIDSGEVFRMHHHTC